MKQNFFEKILEVELFHYKDFVFDISSILTLIVVLLTIRLVTFVAKKLIYKYSKRDKGSTYAVYKLVSYFIWVTGLVIYLEMIGVDITLLIAGSAALLVGIGIGLQQTFNDLISGFILLFEGSIKIDDIVEIDGSFKRIRKIGLRTSLVMGYDGAIHIIPNSKIVTEKVINYTHTSPYTRWWVKVGVAYGSNTKLVKQILLDVAENHIEVLKEPNPFVIFDSFSDFSLDFKLGIFINETWSGYDICSDIRFEIDRQFREKGVTIPFPQRDLHIKSSNISFGRGELPDND